MRSIVVSLAVAAFLITGCAKMQKCEEKKEVVVTKASLKDQKTKVSYSIGRDIGKRMKDDNVEIDLEILVASIKDGYAKKEALLTDEEVKETMQAFQKSMMEKKKADREKKSAENKAAGEKFLADMKTKKGVVSLPSGLMYKVEKEGKGKKPAADHEVTVNYKGTLIDGTEFDSSIKRGKPATFRLNRVIKGWTEGMQLMSEGSKYTFYIPSALGYGERGAGRKIGPNSALIFEVELISVNPNPAPKGKAKLPKKMPNKMDKLKLPKDLKAKLAPKQVKK